MKKIILSVVMAAFLFGCGGSDPAPVEPEEDLSSLIAELDGMLSSHQNACADKYFADTRVALQEAHALDDEGNTAQATQAYLRAKESYDAALMNYNDAVTFSDATYAEMDDQQSRLADLREDGMKYAPNEYSFAERRINQLHSDASARLDECDADGAMYDVDDAEKELFYLEEVIAANMDKETVVMPARNKEAYTVKKGDCLWKIAANKYSNPYFWPLIYWTNKDSIKDPDLIYPNQKLDIDYDYAQDRKNEAEKFSKTRGPWSLYDGK